MKLDNEVSENAKCVGVNSGQRIVKNKEIGGLLPPLDIIHSR